MKKIKWVEITGSSEKERFEVLSKFLNDHGLPNEFTSIEASPSDLAELIPKCMKEYQQIRIGPPYGELVLEQLTHLTAQVQTIQACDSIVNQNEKWWPRFFFANAFLRELSTHVKALDLSSAAMIVGSGAAARAAFSALLKAGFSRFTFTDRFEERGIETVRNLKKRFFNVDIRFISPSEITTLPGIHSILINATPLNKTNDILEDLYYFNFFQPGGTVVDLVVHPVDTPLIQEAEHIGAAALRGFQFSAWTDMLWVQQVWGKTFDVEEYKVPLESALRALAFDFSPFKTRATLNQGNGTAKIDPPEAPVSPKATAPPTKPDSPE